jgi:hypothetical protein
MTRPWILGILAGAAAWALVLRAEAAARAVVRADIAAEKLRQAWANNHTTV